MELSSREAEIPIPINSTAYGGEHGNGHGQEGHGNMAHHHHHHHLHHHHQDPSNGSSNLQDHHHHLEEEDHGGPYMKKKKKKEAITIRYRECLKNHAASMGGNSLDGCGEFMPSGEEGTIEALTCSACNCHRNFHRKEVQGQTDDPPHPHPPHPHPSSYYKFGRKFFFGDHHHHQRTAPEQALMGYPTRTVPPTPQPHQMILPYNVGPTGPILPSESDEQEDAGFVGGGGGGFMVMSRPPPASSSHEIIGMKKRFRTKFTQEQKEKMLDFAEKVGWKIQKQEESVVQQFCQEIGVRRRVLKVWMHNNKHNLAKKIHIDPPPPPSSPPPTAPTTTTALVS